MELYELAWRLHFIEIAKQISTADEVLLAFEAMRARRELTRLADLGLVIVDTHYTVSPVVIQCVIPALALVLAREDDNFEPGPVHPG